MAKLGRTHVMIAQEMIERGTSVRQVAYQLGVDESTLRYRLGRPLDAVDGRQQRQTALHAWEARVDAVLARFADARLVADGARHYAACRHNTTGSTSPRGLMGSRSRCTGLSARSRIAGRRSSA